MNIDEYKEIVLSSDTKIQDILKKSVNTFKHFCSYKNTNNILDVYYKLNEFDEWISTKTLVNQRNAYNHVYIALLHIPKLRELIGDYSFTDVLMTTLFERKENVIEKIENNKINIDDTLDKSDEEYIEYLENKLKMYENKIKKLLKLADIFVYDKYQKVFDIVLSE